MVCAKRIQLRELCNSKIRGCCFGICIACCGCVQRGMLFEKWGKFPVRKFLGKIMRSPPKEGRYKREENNLVTNACNVSVSI